MFGVLVIVLCPDCVAILGFGAGKRQIPLVVSSRVFEGLSARGGRDSMSTVSSGQHMTLPVWLACIHNGFGAISHDSLLDSCG